MNQFRQPLLFSMLCVAVFLLSCVKEVSVETQAAEILVVDASLIVGETVADFHLHGLRGQESVREYSDLEVLITGPDGNYSLTADMARPGYYVGPNDFIIAPSKVYSVVVDFHGSLVASVTTTPPAIEVISTSREYIDTEIQDDLVFIEWSGVNAGSFNEFFYLIELIPEEENPELILRLNEERVESRVISYVPELTLSTDDFNFYGPHTIKVFAISKEYEPLFVPQVTASSNGPSNIQGGVGYYIGVSMVQGALEIR